MEHLDTITIIDPTKPFCLSFQDGRVFCDGKELPRNANGNINVSFAVQQTPPPAKTNTTKWVEAGSSICQIMGILTFLAATVLPLVFKGSSGNDLMLIGIFLIVQAIWIRTK